MAYIYKEMQWTCPVCKRLFTQRLRVSKALPTFTDRAIHLTLQMFDKRSA
jgi:hypothetical protein